MNRPAVSSSSWPRPSPARPVHLIRRKISAPSSFNSIALNQHDIDAVLSSDFDALISQWTEDFVVISPSAVVRGRSANAALMEGARAMADQLEPMEHVLDFEETIVAEDYAFQWGAFRSSSRSRESGEVFSGGGKLMRILQRQADGSWKMHRTMTVGDPGGE